MKRRKEENPPFSTELCWFFQISEATSISNQLVLSPSNKVQATEIPRETNKQPLQGDT